MIHPSNLWAPRLPPDICNKIVHQMNYMFATVAENLCKEATPPVVLPMLRLSTPRRTSNDGCLSSSIIIGLCVILSRTLTSILEGLLSRLSKCFLHRLETHSMSIRSLVPSSDRREVIFSGSGAECLLHQAVHLLDVFGVSCNLYLSC